MFHYPAVIKANMNISTPTTTADFLPTIMAILQVQCSSLVPSHMGNPAAGFCTCDVV
jgi:hypothetical protein